MTECERYQEMIGAMLDGELAQQEKAELRAHVTECPQCQAMLEAFEAISDSLQEEAVQPPTDFTQQVMARIDAAERQKKQPRPYWQRVLALAACLVLVIIGVTPWLQNGGAADSADTVAEEAPDAAMFAASEDATADYAEPELSMEAPTSSETASAAGSSEEQMYAADSDQAQQNSASDSVGRSAKSGLSVVCDADGMPVCTLSDDAVETLRTLLGLETDNQMPMVGSSAAAATAPDYTVELDGEYVSIWVDGDTLHYTIDDGAQQTAAGTAQQLQTLLEQNGAE